MSELKSCPCCKGKAVRETTVQDDVVRCDWCKLSISRRVAINGEVQECVVSAWNTRAATGRIAGVERCRGGGE
jgi:hypothetical protein